MRILAFGDPAGITQLCKQLPPGKLVGIVGADIRPHQHTELQQLAETCQLPLLIQPRANSAEYTLFVTQVRDLKPDIILVNSYSMLLHSEILSIPSLGAINIHGGLLPQYRGCNPIQWALLNCEAETGVTMHYMTTEFDAGDIIAQRRVPIFFEDTWRDIQARIAAATDEMLAEELPKLLNGTCTCQPQDEFKARYYRRRHPEDGLIDWHQSVLSTYNLIRALVKPHPGAFYYDDPNKIVLDEYMTIPQVTALKYGLAGKRQMFWSEQVALIPLMAADLPLLLECINECNNVLFNAYYKPVQEGQHQTWFETLHRRNDIVIFSIRLLETNKLIGLCQLLNINYVHRSAELQFQLMDIHECGRYDTEVVRVLLNFAFKDLNLRRISLHILNSDISTIHMYEKEGFVQDEILCQAAYINGHYEDICVMSSLRDEHVPT